MKGTLRPGRKAGVLALAVLLLTCVLMAGAVSASDEATVGDYDELVASLSDSSVKKIILGSDIDASAEISVNRSVTIDGRYHTISAESGWSQDTGEKNLLVIENETGTSVAPLVTLENISFECYGNATAGDLWYDASSDRKDLEPYMGAHGIQVYDTGTTQMQLKNIKINGSQGSGIHVNGADVSLVNVTVTNSVWQSVDVGQGEGVANAATLTIDGDTELLDVVKINVDNPTTAEANVKFLDDTSYKSYSFYYYNDKDYNEMKRVWSTDVDAAAKKIAESKDVTFNATVQNTGDDPLAYHADFSKAMNAAEDGATVTQLQNIKVGAPITIDEAITFDGNKKEISGSSTTGYFLKVAVPLAGNDGESVTLQNLNLTITSIGSSANLGGITVRADDDNNPSVPVTLKYSTVDMSQVTTESGMNPAVYFVNASGSEIANNVIKAGSTKATGSSADGVTSRGIVIDGGSEITVSKNDVTMGTGAIVSIGIQFKNGPTDVTLAGNSITATASDSGKLNRAIDITTLGNEGESYTITGTKLLAVNGASFESAVNVIVSSSAPENAELSLTTNGNDFSNVEKGIALISWADDPKPVKLSGSINADDFQGILQEDIIAPSEKLQGKVETTDVKWTHDPEPSYSSSSGNMNNAYRVLFNDGSTTLSVQTDLSSGDKLTKPETPVKDGYTFAGWYKDSACTQGWDFETGISGDMTLYAKWTAAGSSGETEATTAPTATATAVTTPQPTKTQTAAATTSAPQATTAAGVSPTLTQAPAPVAGALFGLLAAGVLLRRRFQ